MAVSRQALLGEGLDSGRYAPSVHPFPQERNQPEGVSHAPTPSSEMGHFRLPLTAPVERRSADKLRASFGRGKVELATEEV